MFRSGWFKVALGLAVILLGLAWVAGVEAAPAGQDAGDSAGELGLPAWFNNLAVAGLALAPVAVVVVQVLKVIGNQIGLPEGYSGYITLIVSLVMVVVAVGAGYFQVEEQVAEGLRILQRVAEAMLTLLAALGWYSVGKKAQIIRPVRWHYADVGKKAA